MNGCGHVYMLDDAVKVKFRSIAIQFPTASTGYLTGKGGLFKSIDGGANWARVVNFTSFITHISFFEGNKGWFLQMAGSQ